MPRRLAIALAGLVLVFAGCKLPPSGATVEPAKADPDSAAKSHDLMEVAKAPAGYRVHPPKTAREDAPKPATPAMPQATRPPAKTPATPTHRPTANAAPLVRKAMAAGPNNFYVSDPQKLRKQVLGYLASAKKAKQPGRVMGIIAPHAGYDFSGAAAGWAYKQLEGEDIETVIVIGGHADKMTVGSVWPSGIWKTPLGSVTVDAALARALAGPGGSAGAVLKLGTQIHLMNIMSGRPDHALETQLPFIQTVLPKAKIVPIYFNSSDPEVAIKVGAALAQVLKGRKVVIVASTDLSHYPDAGTAAVADKAILKAITSLDIKQLVEADRRLMATFRAKNLKCTACGMGGVIAMIEATKRLGAKSSSIIAYDNSGTHAKKDQSRVVGYGALAVYGPLMPKPATLAPSVSSARMFSDTEHRMLLSLARMSIERAFDGKEVPKLTGLPAALRQEAAAFVTLSNKGRLRGCMGTFKRKEPVWKVVAERARTAAFRDPRQGLGNVTKDELSEIDIEISVLSAPAKLADPLSIVLGRHGILIQSADGRKGGTYLPQVGKKFKTKEEFLSHCTEKKAGLPADAWRDPKQVTVFAYTAEVFSESELRAQALARPKMRKPGKTE
jgi:hypothetical protein